MSEELPQASSSTNDIPKIRSKKESLLRRSFKEYEQQKSSNNDEIFIVQIVSDDSENENSSPTRSQQQQFIKNLVNSQQTLCGANTPSNDMKRCSPPNPVINNNNNNNTDAGNFTSKKRQKFIGFVENKKEKKFNKLQDGYEIIDLEESVSSKHHNTRLNTSSETSDDFIVSESSRSIITRRKLKNTIPGDNFERYLTKISKDQPEMSHRERVLNWNYTNDVSDVEDYLNPDYDINNLNDIFITNKLKEIHPNCSSLNLNTISSYKLNNNNNNNNNNNVNNTNLITSQKPESISSEENVLMSINTQTQQIYTNHDNDEIYQISDTEKSSSIQNLHWIDDDIAFQKMNNNINPEIDKTITSKLIKNNNNNNNFYGVNNSIIHEQIVFKRPNVPGKYLSNNNHNNHKIDSQEKEELYKYLGIGSRLPNGKFYEKPIDIKRRSLRVRRLQQTHNNKDIKIVQNGNYSKSNFNDDDDIMDKSKNTVSSIFERLTTTDKICIQKQINHKNSIDLKTNQTTSQCSSTNDLIDISNTSSNCSDDNNSDSDQIVAFRMQRFSYLTSDLDKNHNENENNTTKSIDLTQLKSIIIKKHTYNKIDTKSISSIYSDDKGSYYDMTPKRRSQELLLEKYRNGIKIPINNFKRKTITDQQLNNDKTLLGEIKTNLIAEHIYKKLKKFLNDKQINSSPTSIIRNDEQQFEIDEQKSNNIKMKINNNNTNTNTNHLNEFKNPIVLIEDIFDINNFKNSTNYQKINNEITQKENPIKKTTLISKKKENRRKILRNCCKGKILRSLGLNQRKLRNKKILKIVTTQRRKKIKRTKLKTKSRCSESDKSRGLLSPARIIEMANDEIISTNPIVLNDIEISEMPHNEIIVPPPLPPSQKYESSDMILEIRTGLSSNLLLNPLNNDHGEVLYSYFEQNFLIVVQKFMISFWKYIKLLQIFGKPQEWENLGYCKRKLDDEEIRTPYKNRLCINETNPIYLEFRARQLPDDPAKECNMASVYVNVYYFNEWKAAVVMHSVQLDTIRGLLDDICYTTITNTRYFVMCWKQETPLYNTRIGLCKYSLTPDLDTLASIREFRHMRHVICQLECLNDDKLIGFGKTQITIWDHRTGDVLTNFDIEISIGRNLGTILCSIEFKEYLILYQQHSINENFLLPELKIIAINLSDHPHTFRLIYNHQLLLEFNNIKSSICTNDYLLVTSIMGDEFLLLPQQPFNLYYLKQQNRSITKKNFYLTGCTNFVEITENNLLVKTIYEFLMDFLP